MKKYNSVTCIISTYKKLNYLNAAIDSVLCQTFENIELIITDDGSENFDEAAVREHIENNKKSNIKNYIIIHHPKNLGTIKNLNGAIKMASGDFIMDLACDDAFYDENVIEKVAEKFRETQCKVMSCSVATYTSDLSKRLNFIPNRLLVKHIKKRYSTAESQYKCLAMLSIFDFCHGAALYYDTEFMQNRGGHDEHYKLLEDITFASQVTRSGTTIELAYDIVAIKYRNNGISSKVHHTSTLLNRDLCLYIKREYLDHAERFNVFERNVLEGRHVYQEKLCHLSLPLILRYPLWFINGVSTRFYQLVFLEIISKIIGKG